MTLEEIQNQLAIDFDSSATALSSNNPEYLRRTKLINRHERLWAERKSHMWNVLLKETTLTIPANTNSVTLPTDFTGKGLLLSLDGYVKIGGLWHKMVKREEIDIHSTTDQLVYITGNDAQGYTLKVQPTSTEERTVVLNYYSNHLAVDQDGTTEKVVLTETTDTTKCPNPYYLIYSTLAALYKSDDELDKGLDCERLAEMEMDQMMANENQGAMHQELRVMDLSEIGGYSVLGE